MNQPAFRNPSLPLDQRIQDLCNELSLQEKIDQMSHAAKGVPRLGIPPYSWWSECLHGVARGGRATVFPQAINLAATFNPDLLRRVGSAIGDEARAKFHQASALGNHARYTGLTFWTPTINIFRDPRWGRGQETYGEDPALTSIMGRAMVRGLQGDDPRYLKVAACAKHFAVHSGPEGERHTFNAQPSPQDLHDTYLPAFRALVEEGVEIVMGAYNLLDGEPCCASHRLLTNLLRDQWGFQGHVTSDCWAIDGFHRNSKVTCSELESVVLALRAGCDLCCGDVYPLLAEAVAQGLLSQADIDRSFSRLARTWFRLGLLDPAGLNPHDHVPDSVICAPEHRTLARDAATQSIVLLKNAGPILPLPDNLKVLYLVGPHAASVDVLLGNYFGSSPHLTTILEGITARVHPACAVEYKMGCLSSHPNLNPVDWVSFEAAKADVCIAVMGIHPMMEGEEGEAIMSADIGDRCDIDLPAHQIRFLRKIKRAGAKLIVLLTGGGPISCPELHDLADALLWIGYPGEAGGHAVASILFGDQAPSGRLPVTWPRDIRDLPDFSDYSMDGRTYRYMDVEPLYPFGFGLSTTSFAYESISLNRSSASPSDDLQISALIRNLGPRDAEEVVQLYLRWHGLSFRTPRQALKAFQRLPIPAGQSRTVDFTLPGWARQVVNPHGSWIHVACDLEVIVASACPIPRSLALGAPAPLSVRLPLTL